MERTIECVPNFSEGRDKEKISRIVHSISDVPGICVRNVSSGEAANRTVVTFTGSPEAVCTAAFSGVRKAAELIDMRVHKGTHPRIGATDVLPLVPISGISLEECAGLSRTLAQRIYTELGIPCYCYEAAASRPERKRLEVCRKGEYEALAAKIADPALRPDFGPDNFTETAARSGATVVGARDFLIAVNFNLDSKSARLATEIAEDVRESGRMAAEADGTRRRIPGTLRGCKAIGWYIDEYGIAQVSMNITDIAATPLHAAFLEVCRAAEARGTRVTGTEIIGLLPRKCLVEAGKYFLMNGITGPGAGRAASDADRIKQEGQPSYLTGDRLVETAAGIMGLDELQPFDLTSRLL